MSATDMKMEIQSLIYRYAKSVRQKDPSIMTDLFTDNAIFEVRRAVPDTSEFTPLMLLTGRSDILDYLKRSAGQQGFTSPLIHNLLIDLEGDKARGECMMVGADRAGTPIFMGEYQDAFERHDHWKFSSRVFTILGASN